MQRILGVTAIMVTALMVGGCSSNNFMVYKDGGNFYLTSDCPERKRILCNSGDIDIIVKDSNLPDLLQKELKEGICTPGVSKSYLMDTLARMTNDQRSALKDAFRRSGYVVNKVADT